MHICNNILFLNMQTSIQIIEWQQAIVLLKKLSLINGVKNEYNPVLKYFVDSKSS